MATPRATWKGFLQISLVTIPVKVYPATEASETLAFHQLHAECQSRLQQKRWCASCNREVPHGETVKGFEFAKGQYVVLLPDELDAVQPPSTRVIQLVQFGPAAALELRMIDRAYYLVPDGPDGGESAAAYALMREAMHGKVGIGKLALYGREYLVAVGPSQDTLLLYTLHHAAELRPAPDVAIPNTFAAAMHGLDTIKLAHQVVAALTSPLRLADFTDAYQTDVRRLIDAKIAGNEILVPLIAAPRVLDVREALMQSLAAVSAAKKTPAKVSPAPKRKRA